MLLAIDVGNTQTVIGVFDGETIVHTWRIASNVTATADELRIVYATLLRVHGIDLTQIDRAILACVVPRLVTQYETLASSTGDIDLTIVTPTINLGAMKICLDNPHEAGADRIANAVAARTCYPLPAIVVDFGTATNIDVIDAQGNYRGGVISPGLETSAQALFARAARLGAVDLEFPLKSLGTSTRSAVQSGLMFGEVAKVEGLVARIATELAQETSPECQYTSTPTIIATGGLAETLAPCCACVTDTNPLLTLEGLRIIADLNM